MFWEFGELAHLLFRKYHIPFTKSPCLRQLCSILSNICRSLLVVLKVRHVIVHWGEWDAENPEILAVAEKFIFANCYNPQVAGSLLAESGSRPPCQVSET